MSMSIARPSTTLHAALALALVLFGAGCARANAPAWKGESAPAAAAPAPVPVEPAGATGGGGSLSGGAPADVVPASPASARALVVTVEMSVTAKDPDHVAAKLREEVERAGGFVADASSSGSGDHRSARIVLRVPANRTKGLRATIAELAHVRSDTEKSEDVTEQRADLDARLTNARAQERRLVEIMAQKTGSVRDVLEVERELARVRETVERLDAQKRTLEGKIDLATVTVAIDMPDVATEPPIEEGPAAKIARAFRGGVSATGTMLLWGAMGLAAASPLLVPLLVLAGIVVVIARRRRRAQLAAMATAVRLG